MLYAAAIGALVASPLFVVIAPTLFVELLAIIALYVLGSTLFAVARGAWKLCSVCMGAMRK